MAARARWLPASWFLLLPRRIVVPCCTAVNQEFGIGHRVPGTLHRLDKADTRDGLVSVRSSAELGAPYSMLLYERLVGRPFARHRDTVSELVVTPRNMSQLIKHTRLAEFRSR